MTAAWEQPLVNGPRRAEVPPTAGTWPAGAEATQGLDFQQWLRELRPRLVRLAYRYVWNDHDAEEIAQDAIVLACREADRLAGLRDRDAWLCRVTINLCMNRLRRTRAGPLPAEDTLAAGGGNTAALELDELARRVRLVMRELPDRQHAAMVLRDVEGLDYRQIAVILEIRKGAARLLVHRGREAVRLMLLRRWPDSFA